MCYMAVYPPGVMPYPDDLVNGSDLNPHGLGWCVGTDQVQHNLATLAVNPSSVLPDTTHQLSGETLNPQGRGWPRGQTEYGESKRGSIAAIDHFLEARRSRPYEPAVFHARYATGSPVTLANCQPLVLDDGTIVAHNGALFPVDGPESDTRVFAQHYLPHWNLDSEDDRRELRELLGRNKMVILRPGKTPVLLNDRLGVWRADGSWHSNFDYTGVSHLRAGVCGACGAEGLDSGPASMCVSCKGAYRDRRDALYAALAERWAGQDRTLR